MNITPVQLSVKNLDSQAKAQATFSLNTVLAQGKVNAKGDYNLEETRFVPMWIRTIFSYMISRPCCFKK